MKKHIFVLIPIFLLTPTFALAAHVESGQGVQTESCSGTPYGVFCSGGFYKDITFKNPFTAAPKVLVTLHHASAEGLNCVGYSADAFLCRAENVTSTGFRLYCSASPQGDYCSVHGGAYGSWRTQASANWIAVESDTSVEADHSVMPTGCGGSNVGSLCSSVWYTDIAFKTPFKTVPNVLASAEHISDQGGCVGGSTDALICYPSGISKTGFRLSCGGSPAWGACDAYSGYVSLARAGWMAKESTPEQEVQSAHGLETTSCSGLLTPVGTCAYAGNHGSNHLDVKFPKPFSKPPHVIVSPEHVSSNPACAGGGTDAVYCSAENVTATGFRAVCWGSPQYGECGDIYESDTAPATFGYMAVANDDLSCSITFGKNPTSKGGKTTVHWTSTLAKLFYINNVGYVGASGSATVAPSQTTDYSGYVNDKEDGSGTTVACPSAVLDVSDEQCPVGYFKQGNECVFSACPEGYKKVDDQCGRQNQCATPPSCSGDNLVNSCTGATVQVCFYGCIEGACYAVPAPTATLKAIPPLVHPGDVSTISWSSQNAASCSVRGTNGDGWTGTSSSGETSSPILGQTIYTLHCIGRPGATPSSIDRSVTVNLIPSFNEK